MLQETCINGRKNDLLNNREYRVFILLQWVIVDVSRSLNPEIHLNRLYLVDSCYVYSVEYRELTVPTYDTVRYLVNNNAFLY